MKNIKYLRLLAFAPIVIYMMVKKTINLNFTLEMIVLSVIICTTLVIGIYLDRLKSIEEKNRKYLFLTVSISISVIIFLFQFL